MKKSVTTLHRRFGRFYRPSGCLLAFTFCLAIGCADTSTPHSLQTRQRQDAALRDPMNYDAGKDMPTVTSGGVGDMDKNGLSHDIDSILNP